MCEQSSQARARHCDIDIQIISIYSNDATLLHSNDEQVYRDDHALPHEGRVHTTMNTQRNRAVGQ